MTPQKLLNICIMIAVVVASGVLGLAPTRPAFAEPGEGNGFLAVSLFQQGQWQNLGYLNYDKTLSEQQIDLTALSPSETNIMLRVQHTGKTAAHIDAALLDGVAPQMVYGTDEGSALALRKLAKPDFDLIDAKSKTLTLVYALPKKESAIFSLTARIEPPVISQIPFQFPLANLFQEMTAKSYFYTYTWDDQPGSLTVDGNINNEGLGTPFFKESGKTGSGHPDGFTYGWVFNDAQNLYVAMDFTLDNTLDGEKDYAKVYVNTPTGLREFKVSVPEPRWGKPGFIYTPRVSYQHKAYEFVIPLKDLGISQINAGETLSLAFAAYGTASVLPGAFPGPLDPTFGMGGLRDHDIGTNDEKIRDIIPLTSGKLLAIGYTGDPSWDFVLTRYNINGDRDLSFGGGTGVVTTTFGDGSYDYGFAMAIQDDRKIVAAGKTNNDIGLARYLPNGILDITFDGDGLVTTDLGSASDEIYDMAIQSDQKIIVAGKSQVDFALARYTITGTLDTTFGAGGIVITDLNSGSSDHAYGMAIQPDGMIIVGGDSNNDIALARYTITGTLDTTFGTGGIVISDLGSNDSGSALALQEDGKIIVAGTSSSVATSHDFVLARYTITGTLDTTFGTDGVVTTDFSPSLYINASYDDANDLVIQPDGKIVAAGRSGDYFAVARYNPDGSLDTTFGAGGKANTYDVEFVGYAYAVAVQNGGKIVLAGSHYRGTGNYNFGLVRYKGLEFFLPVIIR